MPEKGTSKYRGVYYSSPSDRWIVELERHNHFPCFFNERDAAIYAEYHYRELYGERPNFPDMSEDELACEYEKALTNRDLLQAKLRSTSKQGLKKIHSSASKYVGVIKKDGTRWMARIQHQGKPIYIASFSILKYPDAEILAAKAYDEKALELYGDSARLNFNKTENRDEALKTT